MRRRPVGDAAARAARDARARAPDHPVRDRGDLGHRARRRAACSPARAFPQADPALRRRRGRGADRAPSSRPCRACARWRDEAGVPRRRASCRRGWQATGYEATAPLVARLARLDLDAARPTTPSRRRPSPSPAAASSCCPRPASTPPRPERKRAARRGRARGRGRARRGQARQRRASSPRRRPSSWQAERDKLERLRAELAALGSEPPWQRRAAAGRSRLDARGRRALPARPRALRHALRPRADAPAADRARLAAGALRVDPRRRHQRQVLDGADDSPRSSQRPRACAPAPTSRRTSSSFAERIRVDGADVARRRRSPPRSQRVAARRGDGRTARCAEGDASRSSRRSPPPPSSSSRARGVEVAVIEAGLGGRYDATNVIASRGPGADERRRSSTRAGSARRSPTSPRRSSTSCSPAATLVVGAGPAPRRAGRRRARLRRARRAPRASRPPTRACRCSPPGAFQRRNFALARAAAEAFLGHARRRGGRAPPRPRTPSPAASRSSAQDPLTIFDGAHNPDGMRRLAAALREVLAGPAARRRPVGPRRQGRRGDARARSLPLCAALVFTAHRQPAGAAAGHARVARAPAGGGPPTRVVADPHAALAARPRGRRDRTASCSRPARIYLVADLAARARAARGSML